MMDQSLLIIFKKTTIGWRNQVVFQIPTQYRMPLASWDSLSFTGQLVRLQMHVVLTATLFSCDDTGLQQFRVLKLSVCGPTLHIWYSLFTWFILSVYCILISVVILQYLKGELYYCFLTGTNWVFIFEYQVLECLIWEDRKVILCERK